MSTKHFLVSFGALAALSACQDERSVRQQPVVRPVLSVVAAPHDSQDNVFVGVVEARRQASFGFRYFGRMVARDVKVGDVVKKGDSLAALDKVPFELAVRSAQATLSNAKAHLANESAILERQRALLNLGHVSSSQFEVTQSSHEAAVAAVAQARAGLVKAEDQLRNAELRAEFDGVVTAIHGEVGQVLGAGQSVVTVAHTDLRDAVIDLPDHLAQRLILGAQFEVAVRHDVSMRASGHVREIGPQADAVTRTRRVRIALDAPPGGFRLGTVVAVAFADTAAPRLEIPVEGLAERGGRMVVWIVDPASSTVAPHEVTIAGRLGGRIEIAEGLAPGSRVVVAGLNSLVPGQSVKLTSEVRQ